MIKLQWSPGPKSIILRVQAVLSWLTHKPYLQLLTQKQRHTFVNSVTWPLSCHQNNISKDLGRIIPQVTGLQTLISAIDIEVGL